MEEHTLENIEIELLLEAIYSRYGYDFRNYARASIRRRIIQFMQKEEIQTISAMIPLLMHNPSFFERMVKEFSIAVTEMFRDHEFFLTLRRDIMPMLQTHPFIKVWHAGCASGEEAYSLAILMLEEGLGQRATFFATDFSDIVLDKAKDGIYELTQARKYTRNYQQAGGKKSFSDYYHAKYGGMVIKKMLKEKITFANHNLAVDEVFSETHLILCRNVLIYFNKKLQNRVLRLFYESLIPGGILCLGKKESLLFTEYQDKFKVIDQSIKIYQKNV